MPLTGPLKCLTGEIWQADVSGHLRDTREKKASLLTLEIHMQIHSRGDNRPNPPVNPISLSLTCTCCMPVEKNNHLCLISVEKKKRKKDYTMTQKTQHKAGKQTHVECRKGLSSYSLCQLYLYPQLVNAYWRLSYELCLILIWQSESHRGASRLVGLYSAAVRQLTPSHQRRARLHVGRSPRWRA